MPGICRIDDETFADISPRSHSLFPDRSTGISVALVCKSWCRVATPLLYETVIVHSSIQARTLWATLRKTPALGMHIKRIRLHRGLGKPVGHALSYCLFIDEIFISLVLDSKDNVSGLCAALPLLSPKRVILHDPEANYSTNQSISKLSRALCQSMLTWTRLESFHFPYMYINMPWIGPALNHKHSFRINQFRNILLDAKHIKTLHIPSVDYETFLLHDIVSKRVDHFQAIYSHAPLEPVIFRSSQLAPVFRCNLMRRVLRFPLPGPLTVRSYASLVEVNDVSLLYWRT
ncbi:hypothetical protein BDV93DRAFT_498113 [Ceratobasidium sp. AG-I]|nr:hypothetical protein BDV93DRAFT_498113 [Ceratobasidium sp. AG-I]